APTYALRAGASRHRGRRRGSRVHGHPDRRRLRAGIGDVRRRGLTRPGGRGRSQRRRHRGDQDAMHFHPCQTGQHILHDARYGGDGAAAARGAEGGGRRL
ncbi:unnamed protein product, partial [Prorocentrum cordatum]